MGWWALLGVLFVFYGSRFLYWISWPYRCDRCHKDYERRQHYCWSREKWIELRKRRFSE